MSSAPAPTDLPPDESRGAALMTLTWTLFGIATVIFFLRLWVRTSRKTFGVDDVLMSLAWVTWLAVSVLAVLIVEAGGMRHVGYLTLDELQKISKLTTISIAISICVTGAGKLSIGVTLLRIIGNTSKWQKWTVWAVLIVTTAASVVDMFLTFFQCNDPRALWDFALLATTTCMPSYIPNGFNLFAAAWQTLNDFVFALLPVAIVWNLRISTRKKILLLIMLGLSNFTGIAAAVKTVRLQAIAGAPDLTWNIFDIYVWATIETFLIVVCGSIPSLRPLWERFAPLRTHHSPYYYDASRTAGIPSTGHLRRGRHSYDNLQESKSRSTTAGAAAEWERKLARGGLSGPSDGNDSSNEQSDIELKIMPQAAPAVRIRGEEGG